MHWTVIEMILVVEVVVVVVVVEVVVVVVWPSQAHWAVWPMAEKVVLMVPKLGPVIAQKLVENPLDHGVAALVGEADCVPLLAFLAAALPVVSSFLRLWTLVYLI